MSKRLSRALIVLGLLFLLAALLLGAYNLYDQQRAEESAAQTLVRVRSLLPSPVLTAPTAVPAADSPVPEAIDYPDYILDPTMDMPVVTVDGVDYIGQLDIPALELSLPVTSSWSYELLKNSPCRYRGSAYADDLIIAAHNYSRHFGRLAELSPGSRLYFTDADGNVFGYTVVELEILDGTAVEAMQTGDWDMTLFTCTLGGQMRVTLRCEKDEYQSETGYTR